MNHLAHFALAGPDQGLLVGGFLGDYIKGRLEGRFDPDIERGIRLHRAIDQFTDTHPLVRRSYQRFEPEYRRYAGIICDLAYDHLLARNWNRYYDEPLSTYSSRTLAVLLSHEHQLTEAALTTAQRMHQHNSLSGYGNQEFLERSLSYLSGRMKHANPLASSYDHCLALLPALERDLTAFYPAAVAFCDEWKQHHKLNDHH